ncbi:13335_t:CDS:2, partial [Acaulospora colombiana]
MELAFRGRIAMIKDPLRRKFPLSERLVEVIDDKLTNEVLLDEALKMMKSSEPMSVGSWIDLMSGETWNVLKIGYQLKQVRERLAKGLVDKGILRTEKRNFLLFDMATHPVSDSSAKDEIVKRVIKTLTHLNNSTASSEKEIPFSYLRTISMVCAAYAANVLENALLQLNYETRERAYTKVDELLSEYSVWPFSKKVKVDIPEGKELQIEVVAAVLNVFTKMD